MGIKYRQPGSADGSEESQGGDSCKLLIAVWHVLTGATADRFAAPEQVACAFFALAYKIGVRNLPAGAGAAVRPQPVGSARRRPRPDPYPVGQQAI